VRRSSVIVVVSAFLAAVGVWMLIPTWRLPQTLRVLPTSHACGAALLTCATALAMLGLVSLHRACRQTAAAVRSSAGRGSPQRMVLSHPDMRHLLEAVELVSARAAEAIRHAEMRARETEIQIRVVTAERQHLEAIIHSISDAVLVTNAFDELVLANDSAARLFGFDLDAARRTPIDRVVRDEQVVTMVRDMRHSRTRGGRRIVEYKTQTPSGERVYKATLSCISGQDDEPEGVVAVLHDMTREREVAQMKNDFVSNVSHELRTPLASIKAYAEMLIDGEAADQKTAHEFYEIIHNEANRLSRLIDNILNISRIESGVVRINKQPLSLTVVLKEAIEVIAPQARQKQIAIVEQISPAIYQTLADRDMLYEAVLNLLSNAVKYTPEKGRITVETIVDESRKTVTCLISDTGVGIPPKDLPFIFDKFFRSEANSRVAKGTGLGLSLVKHIIETVHHGRLLVRSEVGKGSTFGFELNLTE